MLQARSTISEKRCRSGIWTQCAPQASDNARAVDSDAVSARIGTSGRSRATRSAVDPDVV